MTFRIDRILPSAIARAACLLVLLGTALAGSASAAAPWYRDIVCARFWCLPIAGGDGDDAILVERGSTVGLTPPAGRGNGQGNGRGGGRPVDVLRLAIIDAGRGQDLVVNRGTVSGIGEASASHKVPARAEAYIAGIDAGEDDDIVRNEGDILVSGSAEAQTTSAVLPPWAHGEANAVAVGIEGGDGSDEIANSGTVAASAEANVQARAAGSAQDARAEAIGISGGAGGDRIENSGTVTVSSLATTGTTGGANPSGRTMVDHNPPPGLVAGNTAESAAAALSGSSGDDEITHSGSIAAGAEARAGDAAFTVRLHDASMADLTTSARANGTGIAAGSGDDRVSGSGSISAAATADAGSVDVTGVLEKNVALDVGADAAAAAAGIDGGDGNDTITLSGATTAAATSTVHDVSVDLDYIGKPGNRYGNVRNADNGPDKVKPFIAAAVSSSASATGIDGGAGDDAIANAGSINATATATVTTLAVSVEADEILATDVSVHVTGAATGIAGGDGNDNIVNAASIVATGSADATGVSTSVALDGGGVADAGLSVRAIATGIAGGAGDDTISNAGTIAAYSSVDTPGAVLDVTASDNAAVAAGIAADAIAVGIDGGAGNDNIVNSASIAATAVSSAESGSVSASFPGSASLDAATSVTSNAFGIEGGAGNDTISNAGTILASATSTVAGAIATDAEGEASVNSAVGGEAIATGISGGVGDDTIVNSGRITAIATGTSDLDEFSGEFVGRAAGAGGADAASRATGIDGGSGDDTIGNRGAISSTATSTASSRWISAVLLGGGMADSSATATALSWGIAGGSGNDLVENDNVIAAGATASAESRNATFTAVGGAFSSTDNTSNSAAATAAGIDGGEGSDRIVNRASVAATATATAYALGTSVTLLGIGVADASSTSTAGAVGIAGGEGDDRVENVAGVTAAADATTDIWNISVTGAGLASTTDILDLKTTSRAGASAAGITGGGGNDNIVNRGPVTVNSTAAVTPHEIAVALVGGGGAAAGASAEATGTGIGGGAADDRIVNTGTTSVTSTSDVTTVGVAVVGEGVAVSTDRRSESGTTSAAGAVGIDGGAGDDSVGNSGTISASATGTTTTYRASVALSDYVGSVIADASSKATADATGIAGGEGDGRDALVNDGSVTATAISDARAFSGTFAWGGFGIPFDLLPLLPIDVWETSRDLTAISNAAGISGGGGNDNIVNRGTIVAEADADALWIDLAGRAAGSTSVDAPSAATARATGISGGAGDDDILNLSGITVTADADTISGGLAFSYQAGKYLPTKASANTSASADTTGVGIEGGDGANRIESGGTIGVTANSDAVAASLAVELMPGSGVGRLGGFPLADSSATAIARAKGVTGGDNTDAIVTRGTITADATSLAVPTSVTVAKRGIGGTFNPFNLSAASSADSGATGIDAAGGDDAVTNDAGVTATATADVVSDGVSVTLEGVAAAYMGVETTARATGISAGAGADRIANFGALSATADATFWSLNLAVAKYGASGAANPFWDGGSRAHANAYGIDAGDGDDAVWNVARIDAAATDNTISNGVSATLEGLAATIMTSTLDGEAVGIAAGGGHDNVYNAGDITAVHRAEAWSLNVGAVKTGIAVAADAFWDGGTKALSYAAGIDGGGGDDAIENRGRIGATSQDNTYSVGGTASYQGFGVAILTTTADAKAAGIAGGDGADTIANFVGPIEATAEADADTVNVSLNYQGFAVAADAVWDGGTRANARAVGIDGGAGNDNIVTTGGITAGSGAETTSVGVSGSYQGVAVGIMTSTADSETAGIAGGEGADAIGNYGGAIDVTSTADAVTTSVAVNYQGVSVAADAVWDGGTKADARGLGIDGGAGNDNVVNTGGITARSDAETDSIGVSGSLQGVAVGIMTSTADSETAGIAGGEGDDVIGNGGAITASAISNAHTTTVSLNYQGVAVAADAVWDGGTTADARAVGIDGGAGNDNVANTGTLGVTSEATADSNAISASIQGVAGAIATSTALSRTAGIAGGDGTDAIRNSGAITATDNATAYGVQVAIAGQGVAAAADAVWDGGTGAVSRSAGIDGGDGGGSVWNNATIDAASTANTTVVGVSAAVEGVGATIVTSTADAAGTGIAGGGGAEKIENFGAVSATVTADANTVSISVAGAGVAAAADAVWDGGTTAVGRGAGIDAGAGSDNVANSGPLTVTTTAESDVSGVSATLAGVGATIVSSNADAGGTGIASGEGDDEVRNSGAIGVTATANSDTASIAFSGTGVAAAADSVWDAGTKAVARAAGIDAAGGNDNIVNLSDVNVTADAQATSVSVSVALLGAAAALATATDNAVATGIAGGDGADAITNRGALTVTGSATVHAVTVSATFEGVAGSANAVWDGGTTAEAHAVGIDGGAGNDNIVNFGRIATLATDNAYASGGTVAVIGVGGTVTSATARAGTAGIFGGDGADTIGNAGEISVDARANAERFNLTASLAGVAVEADSSWDSGTTAEARAAGIDGGGDSDDIVNRGRIGATATATSKSSGVSAVLLGAAATVVSSTATSRAAGIEGGDGDDAVWNEASLTSSATSTAEIFSLSVAPVGMAAAVDAIWDSGPDADATAVGIDGGAGADNVTNLAAIDADAQATANATGVSVTLAGAGFTDATLTATARSTGLGGGDGNDRLLNYGSLDVFAKAKTDGSSTAVTLAGYGDAKLGTTSEATGVGIDGGAGNDNIVNGTGSAIDVLSEADADSGAVTVGLAGDAPAGGGPKATATAVGIDAGAGDDAVDNYGSIDAIAKATADAGAVSVELIGYAPTDVAPVSTAAATGIAGGDGSDVIVNAASGAILATAADNTAAASNPVSIAGESETDARLRATARATGIDGGAGADAIGNYGRIETAAVTAKATSPGASVNIFGLAHAMSDTIADSTAVGIAGGAGNDNIVNGATGEIAATAAAVATSGGAPVNIFGEARAEATLGGTSRAAGIDAGDGDDAVLNAGAVRVVSRAKTDASGTSTAIFGDANGTAGASATVTAVGIDGGAGNDTIVNTGSIRVAGGPLAFSPSAGVSPYGILASSVDAAGIAWAVTSNSSWNLFGEATSGATLSAASASAGIRGGEGNDAIRNDNTVEVEAWANASASGNSKSFIGDAQRNGDTGADAAAAGIEGNGGDDTIVNAGRIVSGAHAGAAATGTADLFAGTPSASAAGRAAATAAGIDAGDGNNVVENDGTIETEAEAAVYTNAFADSDLGKNWSSAVTKTGAAAYGIRSGDGDDLITNRGTIAATATAVESSNTTADEDANAKAGNVDYAPLLASATGIFAGEGGNSVTNDNTVSAESTATVNAKTISKSHFDTAYGTARVGVTANADGIRAGSGPNTIVNNGSIAATARANGDATTDYPSGEPHLDVTKAVIGGGDNTLVSAAASGIRVGDGFNTITNRGTITALAQITESALAWANTETTRNYADAWAGADGQAAGIRAGNGNNTILNFGVIDAAATVTATLIKARADEYGTSLFGKDGSFRAAAAGIRAGDGNNIVTNDNAVTVSATATGSGEATASSHTMYALATAKGGAVSDAAGIVVGRGANRIVNSGTLSVGSSAAAAVAADFPYREAHLDSALASAGGAEYPVLATAAGIRAGHGANTIVNTGSIAVDANGTAVAWSVSGTYAADTTASASASAGSFASGIEAGDGGNFVENRGTITVHATSYAIAGAYAGSTWGDENPYATVSSHANAYGILTGRGNDTILNYGSIHAEASEGRIFLPRARAGFGISSGAGNDGVFLMEGSRLEGDVDLGQGDDALTVAGNAALTGCASGNAGSDVLVLQGSGGLAIAPVLFEALTKEGEGTFTLPSLSTVRRIEAVEGTLGIGGDYRLASDGTLLSHVHPDGRNGRLQVGGTATLGGTLEVVRKDGAYIDGTKYALVTAGTIAGGFGTVILPEASPLVSFAWEQSTDNVSVAVSARSFASAAGGRSESAVATSLDAALPVADGEMAAALGAIQRLSSTSDIRKAYASLSPEPHGYIARSAVDSARLHAGSLRTRMAAVRDGAGALRRAEGDAPVRLAYAGLGVGPLVADGHRKREDRRNGVWLIGYSQSGDQDAESGFNGFDYTTSGLATGYDRAVGDRFVAGGSFGYSLSSVHIGGSGGDGNVKSNNFSVYATWFTRQLHLDAALSYGVERFENNRNIDAGVVATAHSTHDGETFSAFLGGGSVFPAGPWRFEPVASVDYVRLSEKGFQEEGAGPLSLAVAARDSDTLVSEVGLRVARTFSVGGGDAIPELGVAWKHDFGIDREVIAASYAGAPGSVFSVEGQPIARDGIAPHAGFTFAREGGLKTSLRYLGDFRRKYGSNAVLGELRYEF